MHLSRWLRWLLITVVVVGLFAGIAWYKLLREVPQPPFANEGERFKYGSVGGEFSHGLPYWIWKVLPEVFPEFLPGPGGYRSFGVVWEPGQEVPAGFSRQTIGFPRIAENCAICHTGTWRAAPDDAPHVVVAAPAHTSNVQGMIRFLGRCAADPRFNADTLLGAIERETRLSLADRILYRFVIIPLTRRAILQQARQLAWMNRPGWPDWGPGRSDPMNLTKYLLTGLPVDDTTGQADFPPLWNLQNRKGPGLFLNWSCDTPAVISVEIDSGLGVGAAPDLGNPIDRLRWALKGRAWFLQRMDALDHFLSTLPAPAYPFAIDRALAARGRPLYVQLCASCHQPGAPRTSKLIPIAEIQTDRERMDTWSQVAADRANRAVKGLGIVRPDLVKQEGYASPPLDGLWMRAPYLHNGSVPTLRDLLRPDAERPKVFYRGYDVYDPVNVGFITTGPDAERHGWKEDTTERGNGNQGHNYGTALPPGDRDALLEFMKTL